MEAIQEGPVDQEVEDMEEVVQVVTVGADQLLDQDLKQAVELLQDLEVVVMVALEDTGVQEVMVEAPDSL